VRNAVAGTGETRGPAEGDGRGVDLSAAFRTNERRLPAPGPLQVGRGAYDWGSGARCHAPAAGRQECAADRKRRCMVQMSMLASCGWVMGRDGRTVLGEATRVNPWRHSS